MVLEKNAVELSLEEVNGNCQVVFSNHATENGK